VGNDAGSPTVVLQPMMVLRSQGAPIAVLLVSPHRAYIRALAGSELKINESVCPGREIVTGDRVALGPSVYEFQSKLPAVVNGHHHPEAFLAVDDAGGDYPIRSPIVLIGTGERSDVRLGSGPGGSDVAVVIEMQDGHALVSLASPPAFLVNGQHRVRHRLVEGDVIQVGEHSIRYSDHASVVPARLAAVDVTPLAEVAPQVEPAPVEGVARVEVVAPVALNSQEVASSQMVGAAVDASVPATPPSVPAARRGGGGSSALSNRLAAWGPLARAVIAEQSLMPSDAPEEQGDGAISPARSRRWPIVLLLVFVVAGIAALGWWFVRNR
jgi:hypothetical protein